MVQPGAPQSLMLRLTNHRIPLPFEDFGMLVSKRRDETDAFYAELQSGVRDEDERRVQRQALAGMIWSKQFYYYDVWEWFKGDPLQPPPPRERRLGRNRGWQHLNNADVISMPDKWEFPWYATWDLAFHCVTFALIDPQFSKDQLTLFTLERFMHPNGHLPAYEGGFSDVNPPVHAWAAWKIYEMDRARNTVKATYGFSKAFSTSSCSISRGGSIRRRFAVHTCSKRASSGSTTSAFSTGATPSPIARQSSKPTLPVGWPCIRST